MKSERIYSFIANLYDFLFLKLLGYEKAAAFNHQQLPINRTDRIKVLDAGCGTGLYTIAVLKRFPNAEVTAFDLNDNMLKRLQHKLKNWKGRTVRIFSADMTQPFLIADEKFDMIITGNVLEHVNVSETVLNLSRHLKKGGYFLNAGVRDNAMGKIAGMFWGLKPYSKEKTISYFVKAGVSLIKYIRPPGRYIIFRWTKEAYIFKKN